MAAGFDTSHGELDAAVWTSKGGSSWIRLTLASLEGPGAQQILGAATLGEQLIAAGSAASPSGNLDAAVWVRSGGAWTRVADGSLGGQGDQQINAIVAGAAGLVAVGSDTSGGDLDSAVWTSTDGRSWDRVPETDIVFGGTGDQTMSSVTWVGGTLVAGGSSATGRGDPDGAIWLSADGTDWKRAQVDRMEGLGRQRIRSLVSIESNRLLAAGSEERAQDEQAAVWIARLTLADPSPQRSFASLRW